MSLNMQQTKQDNGRIPDGSFPARIVQIIDLGEQHNTAWINGQSVPQYYVEAGDGTAVKGDDGFAKKTSEVTGMPVIQPQVQVTYEFPTETINIKGEDLPRWQSKDYTVTSKGALFKLVQALKPGAESISAVLGEACLVQIGSTSGGKAKVVSVGPMVAGMDVAQPSKAPVVFDFDEPDQDIFSSLHDWVQEKIKSATNFSGSRLEQLVSDQVAMEATADAASAGEPEFDDSDAPF